MPDKLKSRKLWIAVVGAIMPIAGQALTDEISIEKALQLSVAVLISYLFGQGYADGKATPVSETSNP
jgi:uncharacterized membrane protein